MGKRNIQCEWITTEDDATWQNAKQSSLQQPAPPVMSTPAGAHHRWWWLWSVALMLVGMGGLWVWRTSQAGLHQIEHEVDAAVQVEMGSLAVLDPSLAKKANLTTADEHLREILHAARQHESPQIEMELVVIAGDSAAARTYLNVGAGDELREVRFYRRASKGWQPTPPDLSLWGPVRQLESDYFVFCYQQQDGKAVSDVATRLDAIYATMLRNFGLPQPEAKRMIRVSLLRNPGDGYLLKAGDSIWVVPSPARYLAPVTISDGDLLAQSIVLALVDDTIAQAKAQYGVSWQWYQLYEGLYLWQLWDVDLPLAAGHADLVKWYFGFQSSSAARLPANYGKACATYGIWMDSLAMVHIPFSCTEADQFAMCCYPHGMASDLARMERYCTPFRPVEWGLKESTWCDCSGGGIVLDTVVEYAVDRYGAERLPVLLQALGGHETWASILQTVYGVSAEHFEQGWREYVISHYR